MNRAIDAWIQQIDAQHFDAARKFGDQLKRSFAVYGCMLLLRPQPFETLEWLELHHNCGGDIARLYELISLHEKVTHVAINKPIPAVRESDQVENVQRAPQNFEPVYGDFGPSTSTSPPTQQDFDAAFWVTAKQNGIHQTWAPRWTMFSRGNVSEKARLLTLPSVLGAVEQGKTDGGGCTAVDLYVGIGYFAFSYLKAGVDRVLGWDLSSWALEGLRRGAAANKWSTASSDESRSTTELMKSEARLLVFNESNESASSLIGEMRSHWPPVRHVNCGLIPSSHASLQIALDVIDPEMGGWIHVHRNMLVEKIEQGAEEIRATLQQMLGERAERRQVEIEHINRLKNYAPGVVHCVVDIYIPPRPAS